MQKIIGLDIGSYSIKAVEIINTFKSYEISNFYENVIPHIDEVSPDTILPACMEQLFKENEIKADRIVTAMPGQYISSRVLPFNFSESRKIEAALTSMIEDVVPFDLEDMIVDHQILGTKDGKTAVLAVMTRKNFLATFLEHLQRIDIDPKLVDIDSLAFYNLNPYLDMEPEKCYALVDIGHEKTSVCIVQDGILRMFRSINLGGRYITDFLARDLETSFNEAQRIKHRVSQVYCADDQGIGLQGDDKVIAERMTLAANAIVKELGRTFYAFKTWEKSPIFGIFLSGGTSCIKNLDRYLADQLEVNVKYNNLNQSELKFNPQLSNQMYKMAQSIAIGMRAITSVKRHSQVNLRRGEFAYVQDYESVLKAAGIAIKAVAASVVLLFALYIVQYISYKGHIDKLKEQYKKELIAAIPSLAKKYSKGDPAISAMRADAKNNLKTSGGEKAKAVDEFLAENSKSHSLVLLQEISEAIPKDVTLDVIRYHYAPGGDGNGRLILKAETDTFDSSAAIVDKLKKMSSLQAVEEKSSGYKPGSDKKVVEFMVHANYVTKGDGRL